ncbi:hypothetical protein GCM10027030_09620 [Luteococcus sediminum]|uniref:hypothetical protein n=1 Tax=Luteococcus sp. TaxID=1969402 RepID=UPI00373637F7
MLFTAPPGGILLADETVLRGKLDAVLDAQGHVWVRPVDQEEPRLVADGPVPPGLGIDLVVTRLSIDPGKDDSGRNMPTSLAARPRDDDGYIDDEEDRVGDQLW